MSNSDGKAGFPDHAGYMNGEQSDENRASGQDLGLNDQQYGLHVDPRLNDQSEYSQVGGKRNSNQPYPSPGQQQNQNFGQQEQPGQTPSPFDDQGAYPPLDNQNNYSNPYGQPGDQYSQQNPYDSPYQQTDFGQQGQDAGQYSQPAGQDPYGYPGNADANAGYYNTQQPQQDAYGNQGQYQNPSYDQSYAYPNNSGAVETSFDNNYGDQPFGAPQEQEDMSFLSNDHSDGDFQEPEKKKGNFPLRLAVLFGLVVIGGGLTYAVTNDMIPLGGSDIASNDPIFIKRDNSPIKVRSEEPGGKSFDNADGKKIYDRLAGNRLGGSPEREKLQSRQEQPVVDTASIMNSRSSESEVKTSESRRVNSSGVRTVKTLTVRPSGQIDNSGSVPGIAVDGIETSTESSANEDKGIIASMRKRRSAGSQFGGGDSKIGEAQEPIRRKRVEEIPQVKREPVRREEPQQVAALPRRVDTAPPERRETPPQISSGEYVIQVVARRDEGAALAAFADIQQKYPDVVAPYRPMIQRADLTAQGKGIYYRLRIGPMNSKNEASDVCQKLKSRGHKGCYIRRSN